MSTRFPVAEVSPYVLPELVWLLAFVIGLLVVAGLARLCGPAVRRRWPWLAHVVHGLLPLPCEHVDPTGASITYRERRPLNGRLVLHLICPTCGHARPLMNRSDEEREVFATLQPAHEQLRARVKPAASPAPPQSALHFDATKRSSHR